MWHNIKLKNNVIERETGKATLIKIPNTNWVFWIPQKLVRVPNSKEISIGINEDFEYKLMRLGEEKTITGYELIYEFGYQRKTDNTMFG